MTTIADFTVVQTNGSVHLPKPNGDIDQTLDPFDAANVNLSRKSILTFRAAPAGVDPAGDVTLETNLNGDIISTVNFSSGVDRTWHEVVSPGTLHASDNLLTLTKTAGSGDITVSNIVMFFQAEI